MQAKKFSAPDMRTALKMVKEALGDSAIILGNQKVGKMIEVIAVKEEDFSYEEVSEVKNLVHSHPDIKQNTFQHEIKVQAPAYESSPINHAKFSSADRLTPSSENRISSASEVVDIEPRINRKNHEQKSLEEENRMLKEMLQTHVNMSHWGGLQFQQPALATVTSHLYRLGLKGPLVRSLMNAIKEHKAVSVKELWRIAMAFLCRQIKCQSEEKIHKGGVFAVVGPTGAGKTTTIAKLATRFVLSEGCDNIALVTTDAYRVGAGEQLSLLASMLNVPMSVITPKKSLNDCLNTYAKKKLVLIDTAGLPKEDDAFSHHLDILHSVKHRVKFWSVMPANAEYPSVDQKESPWSILTMNGAVITKIDEAIHLGGVISAVIEKNLEIQYVTNGLRIPDHIVVPSAKKLLQTCIQKAENTILDEEEMLSRLTLLDEKSASDALIEHEFKGATA